MGLLAPLFLLGALAVGLPFVFHLIRRSSKDRIKFSSLIFLQPSPPRVTNRSRLEHLFLLFLRCLVLCLLAFAFARPFFQKPILMDQNPVSNTKWIVLVDTGASMRREGLWAAAAARADEVLRKTAPGDQVAIYTFDNTVHPLINFDQWTAMNLNERASLASARVAALKPDWNSTHFGAALTAAAEAFSEADKQGQNIGARHIVMISDLAEGGRLDRLQGYDWPRGVDVQLETVAAKKPTNAGLQWVADTGESSSPTADIGPRIRVSNSADATKEQFLLQWNDVAGSAAVPVYVPPGQSRIVESPKLPANTTAERLVLTGDDDEFDDTVYVIQPKPEKITVLYLGDENETNSTEPLYFLKRAFQQTHRQDIEINSFATGASIPPEQLASSRLLIIGGPASAGQNNPQATLSMAQNSEALQNFLSGGGTILFVMKNAASVETLRMLAGTSGVTATDVTPPNYAMFGQIDFEHPLFAPFADPRFSDFTKIHFWKYRKMDAAQLPGSRVLAKFDDGDPGLIEVPKGKGRLMVLTSGWQPSDSQLALSSKFVPILYSLLDLSGGIRPQFSQYHPGDEVDLAGKLPNGASQSISVRKPDGTMVALAAGQTKFSQTTVPGIYTVAAIEPPIRFVVNLDPAVSRTAPLAVDTLERLGVPLKRHEVEASRAMEEKRRLHDTELEDRQKLWRWLTLIALGVILLETWLAGRLTRRTAFSN